MGYQKLRVNVHIPWWVRRSPDSARFLSGGQFFEGLINKLMNEPEVILTVSQKPIKAQTYDSWVVCLNYHRTFGRKGNLNVKSAYLPDFFYVDRSGYSGWSEITKDQFESSKINLSEARNYFQKRLWEPIISKGISKYPQPNLMPQLPKEYVFVPLQVPGDQVLKLAHFSQQEMLEAVIGNTTLPVVIKPHPMAARDFPDHLNELRKFHNPREGIYVVDGHLHHLLRTARVVVCTNSGVGVEALLVGRPVITCGRSDYHHLTTEVERSSELPDAIKSAKAQPENDLFRYAKWLFGERFVDVSDSRQVWDSKVFSKIRAVSASLE